MNGSMSPSAKRVQDALLAQGVQLEVRELAETTRTAQDAANAIGCELGQIAKSLIFRGVESNDALLFIVSGANKLNEAHAENVIGERLAKADAEFVRIQTGFAIGGVPPVGHTQPLRTFIDQDLLEYNEIWAAAGTPFAVFELTPEVLVQITNGCVISVV